MNRWIYSVEPTLSETSSATLQQRIDNPHRAVLAVLFSKQTNFSGLTLVGAMNGGNMSVLTRIGLDDGSVYSFEYNTYCQVRTIRRYSPNVSNPRTFPNDYFQRAYVTYNLPADASAAQTDCPRFTTRTDWAHEWNPGAVTSTYGPATPNWSWGEVTLPDGTVNKEIFAKSGWQRGLTTQTETWSGGVRKKWTALQWTQDNTAVSYLLNPRVTETNVYDDAGNRRRTTIGYTSYGLPLDVHEYEANATTVLRRTHTDYNLSSTYTSRRIIGLPSAQYLYDGGNNLFSKVDYQYDLGGEFQVHQGPPIRHDTANYGSGFVQGRGNLNNVRRWDTTDPNNAAKVSEHKTGYNTSGSVIFRRDPSPSPLIHQTNISYTDSFSDLVNRNTLAYPTTVTDAGNFSSTVQYNKANEPYLAFGQDVLSRSVREQVSISLFDAGVGYRYVDGPKINYADRSEITGFRDGLTDSPQEHDAFRHIQVTAGFRVLGQGIGNIAAHAMTAFLIETGWR
jgi:hypothetical protein